MMSEKELYNLLSDLQSKPHRLVINNTDYFKYVWDDGTTEEVYFESDGKSKIYINGKYVFATIPKQLVTEK